MIDTFLSEYALYTRSTHTVSITPKVRELAQAAVGNEKNPYLQAKRIYDFLREKMYYRKADYRGKTRSVKTLDFSRPRFLDRA